MTSLRETVKRLLQRTRRRPENPPRPEFSYTLYWTKMARTWTPERRHEVAAAVRAQLQTPGFYPNEYLRRFRVPGLDDQAHSGLSLQALAKVLQAFEQDE